MGGSKLTFYHILIFFQDPSREKRFKTKMIYFLSISKKEGGKGTFGCIIFLILLSIIFYISFQISRPYIKRSMMDSKLEYLASWSLKNPQYDDKFLISSILKAADELSIDLIPENIDLERTQEYININIYWEDEISLPYFHKDLEFEIKKFCKTES